MAEFFIELFSEEIPARLQKNLREELLEEFQKFFLENRIQSKKNFSFSEIVGFKNKGLQPGDRQEDGPIRYKGPKRPRKTKENQRKPKETNGNLGS